MKRILRGRLLAVVLAFSMTVPVLADVAETVEKYRTSFEKRMNAELDEHGKAARDLRLNYLEALKKLKGELGRAENLKGATQVLAEIEMIEDGEESKELPADADFRFKRVREKWERGLTEIRSARSKKLKITVELYLKALDTEKRRLTRAGEIKDALVIEEEEKRVGDLPEVKALVITPEPGQPVDEDLQDLALASRGAKASGGKEADLMILECSTPDNMKLSGHLTPSECGRLAQKASCRKLCLTHFYPVCDLKDVHAKCSTEYNGELFLAEDLMEFNI